MHALTRRPAPSSLLSQSRFFSSDLPDHTVQGMPALSPTMEVGNISWRMAEGDEFVAGDVLAEIETDKASIDFVTEDDGFIGKLLVADGAQEVPVGAPILVVVDSVDDVAAFKDFVAEGGGGADTAADTSDIADTSASASAPSSAIPTTTILPEFMLTPAARHMSQSSGVDATVLFPGSGLKGRVTKGDVIMALKEGKVLPPWVEKESANSASGVKPVAAVAAAAPTATSTAGPVPIPPISNTGPFETVPNTSMRKIIAKRLTQSKAEVPHFYTTVVVTLDDALALRKELASNFGVKVSVNDLVIKASAMALRDHPGVNLSPTVDISVAVATPSGLITPIVPQTDGLGLSEIGNKVRDLAGRAKNNKLKPEEFQGGSFTISNLGMFGITEFSAVINPPQAAILAVGGGSPRLVPPKDGKGPPVVVTEMTARLSADRSKVDEATAAAFLQSFQDYLSSPAKMLA
ncbi:hypothetical protein TL16_g01063 [Triparma laevis f. inornata]|uniref:Dihydrolipoamide acetyltransferase component of pyruvate dehydrogenase complex n=1 Tax=Triparma laevis f. inornata TaxID=1714386 RepID=A0A9W7DR70_9STRA|nr:hypothetical protein TL16_g01063 [Triparma laevis f. inornata]